MAFLLAKYWAQPRCQNAGPGRTCPPGLVLDLANNVFQGVETVTDEYDDLSDLKPSEMEQVQEWELQFSEKYDLVGKLLKYRLLLELCEC